jgi:peptide/nickel transport system permease protein
MLRFVGQRLLYLLPVLLGVALLTFLLGALLPGDIAITLLGEDATPEALAALRRDLGLDQPLALRFLDWLGQALQGDLGRSLRTGQPVAAAIVERLPVTIELVLLAQVVALALAIPIAIGCAVNEGGRFDRFFSGLAFGSLSVPTVMSAILLIWLFAVRLEWLPATGYAPLGEGLGANLAGFAMPALTLGLAEWPALMRVLRTDLISTLQEDFIAMARAKGLRPARVLFVHALKPSSLTLVTLTGLNVGRLLGGAVIVEQIFALPGIGRLLIGSIYARDMVTLQGTVLFVAAAFVFVNMAVDLAYAALDPRIRRGAH